MIITNFFPIKLMENPIYLLLGYGIDLFTTGPFYSNSKNIVLFLFL